MNPKVVNVYLKFETDSVVDPPVVDERELSKTKTVTLNEDGTYDLNLSISGAVGTVTNKAKVDILMIIDRSSSMDDYMGRGTRLDAVKNAAKKLVDSVSSNESISARYNVVTFNELNSSTTCVVQSWTSDANKTKNSIDDIEIPRNTLLKNGYGTNYQEGIRWGKEQLRNTRDGAQTIVIFLSDGLPTYRNGTGTDWWGNPKQDGDGRSDSENHNINSAVEEISGMSCSAFYAIGAGSEFSNPNAQASKNLASLCEAVNADSASWYSANDTDDLEEIFQKIAAESASILCDHVVVSDILSENVNAVLNGDSPTKLVLTVVGKNQDGQSETWGGTGSQVRLRETDQNGSTILNVDYDPETKEIKLEFPDDYKLEPTWTYTITLQIDATEKAYQNYRDNGYTDKPDENTGTYAGEEFGLYTNVNAEATVQYTYKEESKKENFPKPVILLDPGSLIIEKTFDGLNDTDIQKLLQNEQFKFTVDLTWLDDSGKSVSENIVIPGAQLTYDEKTDEFKAVIDGLSPNTHYEVSESGASIDGYKWKPTWATDQEGDVSKGDEKTVSVTNTYTPNLSLKIQKKVDGDMAETDKDFSFMVKVNDVPYADGNITDGVFTLKDGKSITINNLHLNDEVEVVETGGEGYRTTIDVSEGGTANDHSVFLTGNNKKYSAKLTATTIVTFTNHKDSSDVPLTGVFTDKLPYLLMSSVAILCTAGVLFNNSIKRRRENEE